MTSHHNRDKKEAARSKRRGKEFDTARLAIAGSAGHTFTRLEEEHDKLRMGLETMANFGHQFSSNGHSFIRIDLASEGVTREMVGPLVTTINVFRRVRSSTFGPRYSGNDLIGGSCEIGKFIELCKSYGVAIPDKVQGWEQEAQKKNGETRSGMGAYHPGNSLTP